MFRVRVDIAGHEAYVAELPSCYWPGLTYFEFVSLSRATAFTEERAARVAKMHRLYSPEIVEVA